MRRLLGLPRRAFVIDAEAGSYIVTGFSASGMVTPGPEVTTTEQRVEYLLQRDQAAQRDLTALGRRVERLEDESPRELAKTEQELKAHVARALAEEREKYRHLRLAGGALFVIGLACVSIATLFG